MIQAAMQAQLAEAEQSGAQAASGRAALDQMAASLATASDELAAAKGALAGKQQECDGLAATVGAVQEQLQTLQVSPEQHVAVLWCSHELQLHAVRRQGMCCLSRPVQSGWQPLCGR